MLADITRDQIALPDAPSIDGLSFRPWRSETDFAHIADVMNACLAADGIEEIATREGVANHLSHLNGLDPRRDVIFAEIDGQPIGNARLWVLPLVDGTQVHVNAGNVVPQWRRRGIGLALLRYGERRLREKAAESPHIGVRVFRGFAVDTAVTRQALLLSEGYQAMRYSSEMTRSLTEVIPDLPLPAGIEVRSVNPDQYRQLYDAMDEAFRDHWGYSAATEQSYQGWLNAQFFQPQKWQVGWAGNEIAGMVLNFVDAESNDRYQRQRGWTEWICVRRPWRKQGLAKALIARSLRLWQTEGMTEAALHVDTQNLNGALHLYESMGFQTVKQSTTFEKSMD